MSQSDPRASQLLAAAQDTAPMFGFYEVGGVEPWEDGQRVSIFLIDENEDEIEVVLLPDTRESEYSDLIWDELEARGAAAASVSAERSFERSQLSGGL